MNLLVASLTIGMMLSLLALGVYISFRIFRLPDITADGSFALGGAVAAILIVKGWHPLSATAVAFAAGSLAGFTTGLLHTRFKINSLLAGILVMTALYSVNLHVMGKSNVPLMQEKTLASVARNGGTWLLGGRTSLPVLGWTISVSDISMLLLVGLIIIAIGFVLHWFFRTDMGTAMRATGDNPDMIRALGVNTSVMIMLGLSLSNGLIALSGALLAQYQGFADVQMGIGMVVWGLASVIIGEALVGAAGLGIILCGAVMGSLLFRLLVAIALRWGLEPIDLKLITAVFVFCALILPRLVRGKKRTTK